MIKLKSLMGLKGMTVDTMRNTLLLFESPVRLRRSLDMDVLDDHNKNFGYTQIVREKSKLVDKFDKYEIYRFNIGNITNDIFVSGDFTVSYFNYTVKDKDFIENKVWQDHMNIGLSRKILFEYYLNHFNRIISDELHTKEGEVYWKKILTQAVQLGYKIYVLENNTEKISLNPDETDKYFTDMKTGDMRGVKYRFVIEK